MKKRITVLIIVFAMVLLTLMSCTPADKMPDNGTSGSNDSGQNPSSGDTTDNTDSRYMTAGGKYAPSYLPDKRFDGRELRFWVNEDTGVYYYNTVDVYAESLTAEPINDAVFNRNRYLEDKYGFTISEERFPSIAAAKIRTSIDSGADEFDAVWPMMPQFVQLMLSGHFRNVKDLEYIDLNAPWWDQGLVKNASIANQLFMLNGDISINMRKLTTVVYFNKKLIEELNLENPYDLVRDNKWTIAKMMEMGKKAYKDLNGDDEINLGDRFGIMSGLTFITTFFYGGGCALGQKDGNDIPYFDVLNDRNVAVLEYLYERSSDKQLNFNFYDYFGSGTDAYFKNREYFADDKILFFLTYLDSAFYLREMESPFGIAPVPKWSEDQKEYHHYTGYWAPCLGIPISNEDMEFTGFALEAMAAESKNLLTPAFYDVTLKRKLAPDNESSAMIDIVLDSVYYDPFLLYQLGDVCYVVQYLENSDTMDFVSRYEAVADKAQAGLDAFVDLFRD